MSASSKKPKATQRTRFDRAASTRWERHVVLILVLYLAVVGVLLWLSDDMRAGLMQTPPWLWLQTIALISAAFGLRTLRWIALARSAKVRAPAFALTGIYLSGFPLTLTPARAGELWRVWLFKRLHNTPVRRTLPIIIADRLLDLNVMAIFASMILAPGAIFLVLCATLIVLPAASIAHGGRLGVTLVKGAWKLSGKRAPRSAAFISTSVRSLATLLSWRRYIPLLALSAAAWGLEIAAMVLVIKALGGSILLHQAAASLGIANIAGVLTFIPGGLGGQEVALGTMFINAGNSPAVAALAVAMMRICTLWYSIALGTPFLLALSARQARPGHETPAKEERSSC